jgi:hypothetical protein
MESAKTLEDSWKMAKPKAVGGWIQWKGTDVCMDVHCECGEISHIDGMFCYAVKCPACGAVYALVADIDFIKLEIEPENCLTAE